MNEKYRVIVEKDVFSIPKFKVQLRLCRWLDMWVTIKTFVDDDYSFARREAEELFDHLRAK